MPYVERDEAGRIVGLYGALDPMFQQARNYLSTGKLQERLGEYDAVHAEAARLGLGFDDAVTDICTRWPEWIAEEELSEPLIQNYDPSGAFLPIEEIREAYAASHDDEPLEVGLGEPADDDAGDVGVDGGDASGDYLEEEALDSPPDDPDPSDAVDESDPANSGGVLIQGDALTTSKALLSWQVDAIEAERLGVYDEAEITSELSDLRNRAMGEREYGWTALNDAENEQLQALETFEGHVRAIQAHSRSLRGQIRDAADEAALALIDIQSGWPE